MLNSTLYLSTNYFLIALNSAGCITSIYDNTRQVEYFFPEQNVYLLRIGINGEIQNPSSVSYVTDKKILEVTFGSSGSAYIQVGEKPSHITFELKSANVDGADVVMWGPYPVIITNTIGETVGVVRNDDFAFGIQALNIQTTGGRPGEYPELGLGSDNNAAAETEFGSIVQAYSRERDGGLTGSKIGLFGCPADKALEIIERIEISEGLPHPILDGEWGKTSQTARLSYMITGFGESNVDEVLKYVEKAGFKYVYHPGPFQNWGHFQLSPGDFPEGDESLKRCAQKAEVKGIRVGVHTLSNFITTNDPYVSPVPDSRLMKSGSTIIKKDIDENTRDIHIADPEPFRDQGTLSAAVIDREIIQYRSISDSEPYILSGCKRGAFGTKAIQHGKNSSIGKLIDHPYRVFFPDLEMQDEMADRLVELFNKTGLRQISFDGLEGCERTGHGVYAHNRFVQRCFDSWNMEVINDASRLLHYLWHIHTRMNWGEPWGKATREGMPEYRFKNQDYFNRNLFPRMLGWFQLRLASGDVEATCLSDIEWVLSKGAGFDAGFALSTGLSDLKINGQAEDILNAIKIWEEARLMNVFSEEQKKRLKDPEGEFHLEKIENEGWNLYPVAYSETFVYTNQEKQPGEPVDVEWRFENPFHEQPFQFILRVIPDAGVSPQDVFVSPCFEIGFQQVKFPVHIPPNHYLICDGDKQVLVMDANWNIVKNITITQDLPEIMKGQENVRFSCDPVSKHSVEIKFRTMGKPEFICLDSY
ncbi:hypothetical protein GF312_16420 [Candidatus Poribacteria bacterium]|nr:hypothetical protein [Candidatus Poribacteria bacterium]